MVLRRRGLRLLRRRAQAVVESDPILRAVPNHKVPANCTSACPPPATRRTLAGAAASSLAPAARRRWRPASDNSCWSPVNIAVLVVQSPGLKSCFSYTFYILLSPPHYFTYVMIAHFLFLLFDLHLLVTCGFFAFMSSFPSLFYFTIDVDSSLISIVIVQANHN